MADAQGNVRVLLVDDHADTLQLQAIVLRRQGYEVETAATAEAALRIARETPVDVVVSDLRLPDRDGFELMQDLKRMHGVSGIALTGSAEAEDRARGEAAGFVEYLVKPVLPERLLEAIEAVRPEQNG